MLQKIYTHCEQIKKWINEKIGKDHKLSAPEKNREKSDINNSDAVILAESLFRGTVSNGRADESIILYSAAGSNGRLQLRPIEVTHGLYLFVARNRGSTGEVVTEFSLNVSNDEGITLTSDTVYQSSRHD